MPLTIDCAVVDRDVELLDALRRREASAAERLVSTFGDRAFRLAIGITGNQQDAEEAVQDAFWSVVKNIDTFRGGFSAGVVDLPDRCERRLPTAPSRRASA